MGRKLLRLLTQTSEIDDATDASLLRSPTKIFSGLTVFNLNYVSGSYAAGDAAACMVWFKNMYYIGHIEMITLILLGMTVFPKRKMGKPRAAPPAGEADQAKKAK